MNYNKEDLLEIDFKEISNLEEKKQIASKIAGKVKDGQVIRIWFWFNFVFSNLGDR